MKPKKIIISAWGPYRGKVEVDFTRLNERGIFLITGPTGAGKTTLFDAITYALYGGMSGELREKNTVRSDFADGDTPTYVELTMEHGGREYHILRNPEYLRPKKRQSGKNEYTKEKENAVLTMPGQMVIEGVLDVNRKMQEVLVLDYRQFKQISMIAQGEFARLLSAPPLEKTRIFREIFATAIYDRFAMSLRERSGELYKKIMEYRHRIDEEIHMLDFETVEGHEISKENDVSKIAELLKTAAQEAAEALEKEKDIYQQAEKKINELMERLTQKRRFNELLLRLEKTKGDLEEFKGKEGRFLLLQKELNAARIAAILESDYIKWDQEEKLILKAESSLESLRLEIQEMEEEKKSLENLSQDKELIFTAYQCQRRWNEAKDQAKELCLEIEKKERGLHLLQEEYLRQEKLEVEKRKEYDNWQLAVNRASVGIVARLLVEGEPCPVCGSKEHPQKAAITEEVPDEEGLRHLKAACEQVTRQLMKVHGEAKTCQGELQEKKIQQAEMDVQLKTWKKQWENLPPGVPEVLRQMTEKQFQEKIDRYHRLVILKEEKSSSCALAFKEKGEHEDNRKTLFAIFDERRRVEGFEDVEDYRSKIRSSAQIRALEEEMQEYKTRVQEQENLINHLREETKNAENTPTASLEEEIRICQAERNQILERQNEWNHRCREFTKLSQSLKDREKKLSELEGEYGVVKDLDNLAAGNNTKRLVFEQYVLAGYFEEILRAANIRLARMSGGRFELYRAEEVTDGRTKDNLEIRVLDYYTGKYRSVKTLSGGESFKASLSLALGMSDVIQAYSGGIRVESLFIDEGFGNLDRESLEQACETLLSLSQTDGMIGIISHVPELAEKIESKIVVSKTNSGSSLKIMV